MYEPAKVKFEPHSELYGLCRDKEIDELRIFVEFFLGIFANFTMILLSISLIRVSYIT